MNQTYNIMKKFIFMIIIMLSLSSIFPLFVNAEPAADSYVMIATGTPLSDSSGKTDMATFLPAVFKLGIGIAGALAVIYIIVGGFQYLSTDAINGKEEGKERINNALIGLILAISAYTILNTINPKLVDLNLSIETLPQGGPLSTGLGTIPPPGGPPPTGCLTCVAMPAQNIIPSKTAAENGCSGPGPCVVDPGLISKLTTLTQKMKALNPQVTWRVTEMWPPTVGHGDPCHATATCVDASITAKTTNNRIKFLTAISQSGFSNFIYEACPQSEADKLKIDLASTGFGSKVMCPQSNINAGGYESVHLVK